MPPNATPAVKTLRGIPDTGQALADVLSDLRRQDDERREHQRRLRQQHAEECCGACPCAECVYGDPPVPLAVAVDEAFHRRGIAAAPLA